MKVIALKNVAMRAAMIREWENDWTDLANRGCIMQANAGAGKEELQALFLSPEKPCELQAWPGRMEETDNKVDVRVIGKDGLTRGRDASTSNTAEVLSV